MTLTRVGCLHPYETRLHVSGGGHGPAHPVGALLPPLQHPGWPTSVWRPAKMPLGATEPRNLQHRPRIPVHLDPLHRCPYRSRRQDLHGRPRLLPGQDLHWAALVVAQVRVRLPAGVRGRTGPLPGHQQLDYLLHTLEIPFSSGWGSISSPQWRQYLARHQYTWSPDRTGSRGASSRGAGWP